MMRALKIEKEMKKNYDNFMDKMEGNGFKKEEYQTMGNS